MTLVFSSNPNDSVSHVTADSLPLCFPHSCHHFCLVSKYMLSTIYVSALKGAWLSILPGSPLRAQPCPSSSGSTVSLLCQLYHRLAFGWSYLYCASYSPAFCEEDRPNLNLTREMTSPLLHALPRTFARPTLACTVSAAMSRCFLLALHRAEQPKTSVFIDSDVLTNRHHKTNRF